MTLKKIPYGQSNFADLIESGYAYVKIDMESYYNGYMFNNNAKNKVYNPQMILYVLNQVQMLNEQPENIVISQGKPWIPSPC